MTRIELPRERRDELMAEVKAHFLDVHDEDIGDLKAGLLLDFLIARVGPAIYNQAVRDAQAHLHGKLEDLDAELHVPEE